ncbi:OsmC family protein [Pseudoalteromonas luteoviolacea]|uniref:OsmC family protein n=1 Tax=Pseudoalteromonas luteoviolacea TaxID=43657 RepID=UPI001B35DD27|nr:OsmC family protein [Pseudoalteromonas luteoviolacea]MBQ4811616.1 OsmC family protein [Pseudoalteromonas luteoviolacea]
MAKYIAQISWQRPQNDIFIDQKYSRVHTWAFDGGIQVMASASPTIVPLPYSNAEHIDPEEAFVASLSSCHMLFFLHFAAKAGLVVNRYVDSAEGLMKHNAQGKLAITDVILKPKVEWQDGATVVATTLRALHHQAHEACFLANSVLTEIEVQPQ